MAKRKDLSSSSGGAGKKKANTPYKAPGLSANERRTGASDDRDQPLKPRRHDLSSGGATTPGGVKTTGTPQKYDPPVSSEMARWLSSIGITPDEWSRFAPELREKRRLDYEQRKDSPYGTNVDEDFESWLRDAGISPGEWWHRNQDGRNALRETWKLSPEKAAADAAAADAIAGGAEGFISDPGFFEYVPPVFIRASERYANAMMDQIGASVFGRRLRPDERARAIAAWREHEEKLYDSQVREERAGHAQNVLGTATPFGGGKAKSAEELAQAGIQAPDSKTEKEARARMKSFEGFSKEDFELAVAEEIAALSPREEAGTELRGAFESFLQAIKGRVAPEGFAP